jgi:hypothetical protein
MARSRIITIIPSMQRSFKIGEVLDEVGSFTQDRLTAIAGELGAKPVMVPVTVRVDSQPEKISHTYRYELAREPRLTPELVNLVLANSLARRTDAGLFGTVELHASLELTGGQSLELNSTFAMERDPALPILASLSVVRPLDVLWRNEFGPPLVKSIAVEAKLSREVRALRVEVVSVRQGPYRPGEHVVVSVGLRAEEQPLKFHDLEFDLPEGFEPGDYDLQVGGAAEANQLELRIGGAMHPQTAAGLVDAIRAMRQDGPLYLMIVGKGSSVRVGEALLNQLPLSYATQIAPQQGDQRASRNLQSVLLETQQSLGAYVSGSSHATLRVRQPK